MTFEIRKKYNIHTIRVHELSTIWDKLHMLIERLW